jgi:hypothetical protein
VGSFHNYSSYIRIYQFFHSHTFLIELILDDWPTEILLFSNTFNPFFKLNFSILFKKINLNHFHWPTKTYIKMLQRNIQKQFFFKSSSSFINNQMNVKIFLNTEKITTEKLTEIKTTTFTLNPFLTQEYSVGKKKPNTSF